MAAEYDVFISHASEDKDVVARPLAGFLRRFGVRVWFDEYHLKVGDSLSESIDAGLASSKFGIVILSSIFFGKAWAKRELQGLASRDLKSKVILPILHGVDVDYLRSVSPTLADRYCLSTEVLSVEQIGWKIIEQVRPDIFDNLSRWLKWQQVKAEAVPAVYDVDEIVFGPRRHERLSPVLLRRVGVLCEVFFDALAQPLEEWIDSFCRELYPHEEIEVWERIAACYLKIQRSLQLDLSGRRRLFAALLRLSFSGFEPIGENADPTEVAAAECWRAG